MASISPTVEACNMIEPVEVLDITLTVNANA
jgi:hypothetical protein